VRKPSCPSLSAQTERAAPGPKTRADRLRRIVGLLRRVHKTRARYYDPLFERPDLIEDDYYRLRNHPRG
jgi:hypothetical protein